MKTEVVLFPLQILWMFLRLLQHLHPVWSQSHWWQFPAKMQLPMNSDKSMVISDIKEPRVQVQNPKRSNYRKPIEELIWIEQLSCLLRTFQVKSLLAVRDPFLPFPFLLTLESNELKRGRRILSSQCRVFLQLTIIHQGEKKHLPSTAMSSCLCSVATLYPSTNPHPELGRGGRPRQKTQTRSIPGPLEVRLQWSDV